MILVYLAHDSERGDWRARPAMGVLARGVCRRFGPTAEVQLAPERLPAAARDAGVTAAVPHDSVTAVVGAAPGPLPGAPQGDGLETALPRDSVTAAELAASGPSPGALRHGQAEGAPHDPAPAGVWLEPEP